MQGARSSGIARSSIGGVGGGGRNCDKFGIKWIYIVNLFRITKGKRERKHNMVRYSATGTLGLKCISFTGISTIKLVAFAITSST